MAPDVEELVRGIMEFWQNTILNEENYKRIMAIIPWSMTITGGIASEL